MNKVNMMIIAGFAFGCGGDPQADTRTLSRSLPTVDIGGPDANGLNDTLPIETMLLPSDISQAAKFGSQVAISGDVLVSVAPSWKLDDVQSIGGAYIFLRDPETGRWVEHKKLVPHGTAEAWSFTVAIEGDTIALGTPLANIHNGLQQGAVYIFERHQGGTDNWGEVIKLSGASGGDLSQFGTSLALAGDLLVVGAPKPPSVGTVEIFERNRGGANVWGKATTLSYNADAGWSPEYFGVSLALDGDLLLVGATSADVSYYTSNDGAAYLFQRDPVDTEQWVYLTRLTEPEATRCTEGRTIAEMWSQPSEVQTEWQRCAQEDTITDGAGFGGNVALLGDTAAVTGRGAAYVFQRDATNIRQWLQVAKLQSADGTGFGRLALNEDVLLVGASGTDVSSRVDQGAVHVFKRDRATRAFVETELLIASNGVTNDHFGSSLALHGTISAIGAYARNNYRGAIYLHEMAKSQPSSQCEALFPSTDTLVDSSTVNSAFGVTLSAPAGSLTTTLPVWLNEVAAPQEQMIMGAVPVGPYYNLGAECTTFTTASKSFKVELPVPEFANTAGLGAARLESTALMSHGSSSGRVWLAASGVYDPARRRYVVNMPVLSSEGNVVVLIEHPSFASANSRRKALIKRPSFASANYRRQALGEIPVPRFEVKCEGCPDRSAIDDVERALVEAYIDYNKHKFKDPLLPRIGDAADDDPALLPPGFAANDFTGISVYSRADKERCAATVLDTQPRAPAAQTTRNATYSAQGQSLNICLAKGETVDATTVRHELFHAIQNAYDSFYRDGSFQEDWLMEGTAVSAAVSTADTTVRDAVKYPLRRTDVTLTQEKAKGMSLYPYQAQDFWVHLFNSALNGKPRNHTLGYLADFFTQGAETVDVATVMLASPERYAPLGEEYWAWVKNQTIEKSVRFVGMRRACRLEPNLIGEPGQAIMTLEYSPTSTTVKVDFQRPLESKLVKIKFREGVAEAAKIMVENVEDSDVDLAYKVYLQKDTEGCQHVKDGMRELLQLETGVTVFVLLANKAHEESKVPRSYTLKVVVEKVDSPP
jgi:hypothetical protein